MNKSPAFQFYAAEWLADEKVSLMTLEEEGAYIRLVAYCWREGSIPADLEMLSRLCKGASSNSVRVVTSCFKQHPTDPLRLVHKRLESEAAKQKEWRAKSADGGRRSAEKRWGARSDANSVDIGKSAVTTPISTPSTLVQPNGNSSSSSSSSINTKTVHHNASRDQAIERIYSAYPRKVGKSKALDAILRSVRSLQAGNDWPKQSEAEALEFLYDKVVSFARSPSGQAGEFTPHPATWFNAGRYLDDPKEWQRGKDQQGGNSEANRNGRPRQSPAVERGERSRAGIKAAFDALRGDAVGDADYADEGLLPRSGTAGRDIEGVGSSAGGVRFEVWDGRAS